MLELDEKLLLANLLQCSRGEVDTVCAVRDVYHKKQRLKKNGGVRILHAPCKKLKEFQRLMLERFFYRFDLGENEIHFHGCLPHRSPITNAIMHAAIKPIYTARFDIQDAFPTTSRFFLQNILERVCNNRQYAGTLFPARDVSWFRKLIMSKDQVEQTKGKEILKKFVALLLDLTLYREILPQGAPTSPMLLNIALHHAGILQKMNKILTKEFGTFRYWLSVYVDDFTISTTTKPITHEILRALSKTLEEGTSYHINPSKTLSFVATQGGALVTGLRLGSGTREVVGKDGITRNLPRISVPKKELSRIRGIFRVAIKRAQTGDLSMRPKVNGHIAHLIGIYGRKGIPSQVWNPYCIFLEVIKNQEFQLKENQLTLDL